ncbi:complement C1q tumor necrosis factor-related protein 3-like [Ruditapes philippinarum]|uniref:complement C1q tumor necrosis factor-related protein 3-like n=1 Tax=Ruditapes philippinarum TaxID=129788 RepID=UPI00295C265B|nr:complement C1q tumor necrosis factor-related protein 3-like [Ruditapes philippinarum]
MTYYIYSFLVLCLSLGMIFYTQKLETLQLEYRSLSAHVHAIQTETATTLLSLKKEIDAFRAALNDEQKKKDSLNGVIDKLRAELIEERNKRKHFEETIASQQTELEIVKVAITSQEQGLKAIGPRIAFFARVSPTIVGIAPWATIIFSNVETNEGVAYNNATGEFVAPKAGLYVFFSTILAGWGLIIETGLQVNGNSIMLIYSGGSAQASGSNMAVLPLKVGDVVKMVKTGPWGTTPFTIHHYWSTFSGFLLKADDICK